MSDEQEYIEDQCDGDDEVDPTPAEIASGQYAALAAAVRAGSGDAQGVAAA